MTSTEQIRDDRTIAYQITGGADRFKGVHPNALTKVRLEKAKYVTAGLQEYFIFNKGTFYYIKAYKSAILARHLQGAFMSFGKAETALIAHIRSKDKWGRAIYPGKETRDAPRPD